jgi:hypothetical protein
MSSLQEIKIQSSYTGGNDAMVNAQADKQKNLIVAQGNPSYMETRRRAESWSVFLATASEGLATLPTTLAHLEVHNNGTRLMVVSDLHLYRILGTAVGVGENLWVMITRKAIPTLGALVLYSNSGKAAITPTATSEIVTGIDTTVVADGWMPYGLGTAYLAAATPGTGSNIPINGKLVVPSGCSLCVTIGASVNTASAFHCGVTFDMVDADMEN